MRATAPAPVGQRRRWAKVPSAAAALALRVATTRLHLALAASLGHGMGHSDGRNSVGERRFTITWKNKIDLVKRSTTGSFKFNYDKNSTINFSLESYKLTRSNELIFVAPLSSAGEILA